MHYLIIICKCTMEILLALFFGFWVTPSGAQGLRGLYEVPRIESGVDPIQGKYLTHFTISPGL